MTIDYLEAARMATDLARAIIGSDLIEEGNDPSAVQHALMAIALAQQAAAALNLADLAQTRAIGARRLGGY
jgi:hypothetical protein